jgi:hypothetical protein
MEDGTTTHDCGRLREAGFLVEYFDRATVMTGPEKAIKRQ